MRQHLRSRIFFVGMLLLSMSVTACKKAHNQVVLQREWVANAEFAGDVWAADEAGRHGIDLGIREGSDVRDSVKEVRSGSAHFGVASADRILRENASGADLVVIACSTYRSPVVFLSHPEDQIHSPADFRGHT